MTDALLHLTVLITAVWGFIRGYRTGFTGQVAGVLGIAFGAVSAHAFGDASTEFLRDEWPGIESMQAAEFLYNLLGYLLVFGVVCGIFVIVGRILRSLMETFQIDILNALSGAVFCGFKYLFMLSIVYNLIGGMFPHSKMIKYAHADDGNLVEIVMLIAPGVMGSLNCEDLHHMVQLRDAKTIS